MTETERFDKINRFIARHDALDGGIADIEPDGMSVAMLVSAFIIAHEEPIAETREALLIYVFDEASRRRHCMQLVRWLLTLNLNFSLKVKERLLIFMETCQMGSEAIQFSKMPETPAGA